jgi:hypothetical protein
VRLGVAFALLFASTAAAQQASDVPSGTATIRGRVVHELRPEAAAGVEVVLYALSPDTPPGVRRGRADADGAFAFEGISSDPRTAYLVGARFGEIPYPGMRLSFEAGETEREVEVRIADVVSDPAAVRVTSLRSRVDWIGERMTVAETVKLTNDGASAVFVPEAQRGDNAALAIELPAGFEDFQMPLGVVPEGLVQSGRWLRFYGPVYPGEQEISYSYGLPIPEDRQVDLERRLETPVDEVVQLVPAGLGDGEEVSEGGRAYQRLAGDTLRVPEARVSPGGLEVLEVRMFLELDEAAILVREEYMLSVSGTEPVVGPLLRIPLPEGARNLGFHPDLGLEPHPEGGVSVRGPVPAGESQLDLAYRLPLPEGSVDVVKGFGARVSLLSVFVGDTGLLVESERLHPRRPVRGTDRMYVHLEAFEVEPGEEIALRMTPLPPRRGMPRGVRAGLLGVVALGLLGFLAAPLRGEVVGEEESPESPVRRERESVFAAIRDLEHDYETGKVAEADYGTFRQELRARALTLLSQEREEAPPESLCPGCAREVDPQDRFCSQCGARL